MPNGGGGEVVVCFTSDKWDNTKFVYDKAVWFSFTHLLNISRKECK